MDKDCTKTTAATGTGAGRGRSMTATTASSATPKGKGKNKVKNKGKKGDGKFDGICNKCGRWGHRASGCRSVISMEDGIVALSVSTMAEILSVDATDSTAGVLLMIDSGACMSTCPRL
eukprot:539348-Heterocapsa_arctica.AAC.1